MYKKKNDLPPNVEELSFEDLLHLQYALISKIKLVTEELLKRDTIFYEKALQLHQESNLNIKSLEVTQKGLKYDKELIDLINKNYPDM